MSYSRRGRQWKPVFAAIVSPPVWKMRLCANRARVDGAARSKYLREAMACRPLGQPSGGAAVAANQGGDYQG